jgi:lysophospholipase L1-like esterase
MGLRDDDVSLEKPEIIVLGDSYAMGWGMENEKIFPSLLEKETGMKTLNASVSSYGTAREFLLLDHLDVTNLKYLIIQYCTNDFEENKQYADDGLKLKIQSREFYESTVRNHVNRVKYRPFLYLTTILDIAWKRLFGCFDLDKSDAQVSKAGFGDLRLSRDSTEIKQPAVSSEDTARYFLEIVKSKPGLDSVQVIVMNISGPVYTTPSFIQSLSRIKGSATYPRFINDMKLIDICNYVKREDYFILDNHLNKQGHRKVADLLIEVIKPDESASAFSNSE